MIKNTGVRYSNNDNNNCIAKDNLLISSGCLALLVSLLFFVLAGEDAEVLPGCFGHRQKY